MQLPLQEIIEKYQTLNQELSQVSDTARLIELSKEQKKVQAQYELATEILTLQNNLKDNLEMLEILDNSEIELKELTIAENNQIEGKLTSLEKDLLATLAPAHPRDDSSIFLEIRAGAGGDESSLFAGDLLKMYGILADKLGFKLKIVSTSQNDLGGFKEVIAEVRGIGAFKWFKYEGGVHRVQRVPATEKQGRIHTSTVSVAIMPLLESTGDFSLNMNEVEIIASTSQGAGGQSVNTTYSAIRVRHLPTGIEAQSQDERNQQQNKAKALEVLTARVYDQIEQERLSKETAERRQQVGNNDRSEKIRTYNFPQDRMTDHRYSKSWNQLPNILSGEIFQCLQEIQQIEATKVLEKLQV